MSAVADLLIEYKLGDSLPKQVTLKTRAGTDISPVDLTDAAVALLVLKGVASETQACLIVNAKLGKISFPLNTIITTASEFKYSLVITLPGGETWTHTEGKIRASIRRGSPA